jgi:hypothetical protein
MAGRVIPLATSEQTLAAAATAFLAQPSPTVWPGAGRAQPRVNAETGDRRCSGLKFGRDQADTPSDSWSA